MSFACPVVRIGPVDWVAATMRNVQREDMCAACHGRGRTT